MSHPRMIMSDAAFSAAWRNHAISTLAIARFNGVTRQAVSWRAKALGLPTRAKLRRTIVKDRALFAALWERGVSCTEIAQHFGYAGSSCVSQAAHKMGLPRRQKGGPGGGRNGGYARNTPIKSALAAIAEERMLESLRASAAASNQALSALKAAA